MYFSAAKKRRQNQRLTPAESFFLLLLLLLILLLLQVPLPPLRLSHLRTGKKTCAQRAGCIFCEIGSCLMFSHHVTTNDKHMALFLLIVFNAIIGS